MTLGVLPRYDTDLSLPTKQLGATTAKRASSVAVMERRYSSSFLGDTFVAVPSNTGGGEAGPVWIIQTCLPLPGLTKMSKLMPELNVSVPVQSGLTV